MWIYLFLCRAADLSTCSMLLKLISLFMRRTSGEMRRMKTLGCCSSCQSRWADKLTLRVQAATPVGEMRDPYRQENVRCYPWKLSLKPIRCHYSRNWINSALNMLNCSEDVCFKGKVWLLDLLMDWQVVSTHGLERAGCTSTPFPHLLSANTGLQSARLLCHTLAM